ncbi:MAG: hypothetical protein PWQ15_552 [Methanobacterium sp.]|jgi:hypothetical protein|nr:hypothetical protein [Methanobacterium sp.]
MILHECYIWVEVSKVFLQRVGKKMFPLNLTIRVEEDTLGILKLTLC